MKISNSYIGRLEGANMNTTSDQLITISGDSTLKYIIRKVIVCNPSTSLTLATGGFYTGASKTGITVVSSIQVYSGLTGSTKWADLALASGVTGDILTAGIIYFSLTAAQGSTATADVYIFGDILN